MPRRSKKKIEVIYSALGRQKAWGIADIGDNTIYMDRKLKGVKEMEVLIHESLHLVNPIMEEKDIIKWSILITNTLWNLGFRKVDNNEDQRFQDGTKYSK